MNDQKMSGNVKEHRITFVLKGQRAKWVEDHVNEYGSMQALCIAALDIGMRVMAGETEVVPVGAPEEDVEAEQESRALTPEEGQAITNRMNTFNHRLKLAMEIVADVETEVSEKLREEYREKLAALLNQL